MHCATNHGIDQTLVSVSQIGRQPARRLLDGLGRPLSVGELDRREGLVFDGGVFEPAELVASATHGQHKS